MDRKEIKAESTDFCFSLLVKEWTERNKAGSRFEKGSVSKEHFLSHNSVYRVARKMSLKNEPVSASLLRTVLGLRG